MEPSHLDFHYLQMYVRIYLMSEVSHHYHIGKYIRAESFLGIGIFELGRKLFAMASNSGYFGGHVNMGNRFSDGDGADEGNQWTTKVNRLYFNSEKHI